MSEQTVVTFHGQRHFCPECGSFQISEDAGHGEIVCENCGLVLEDNLIEVAPAQAYTQEEREKKARVGAPLTYTRGALGLTTMIGRSDDLYQLSGEKRQRYARLQRLHRQMTGEQRGTLRFALTELRQFASVLEIPSSIHEEVARLYEQAMDKGVVKGRRIEDVLGALIYIVSRNQGSPRALDEISKVTGSEEQELGQTYRYVARELGLRILPLQPEDYLPRFSGELTVSGEVQAQARHIISVVRDEDLLSGKGPTGVAAAALFLAMKQMGDSPVQRQVAERLDVSQTTLRNRIAEFEERIDTDSALD